MDVSLIHPVISVSHREAFVAPETWILDVLAVLNESNLDHDRFLGGRSIVYPSSRTTVDGT